MSQPVISYELARKLNVESSVRQFAQYTHLKLGRTGIGVDQLVRQLTENDTYDFLAYAYKNFGYGIDKLLSYFALPALDNLMPDKLQPASPFDGLELGQMVGKPDYYSGRTAYTQKYSSGITLCVSYRTVVGAILPDGTCYRTTTNYSVTTSKHLGRFPLYRSKDVSAEHLAKLAGRYF